MPTAIAGIEGSNVRGDWGWERVGSLEESRRFEFLRLRVGGVKGVEWVMPEWVKGNEAEVFGKMKKGVGDVGLSAKQK